MPMPMMQVVPYAKAEALVRDIENQKVAVHMNAILPKLDEVGEGSMAVMVLFNDETWECAGYTDRNGNIVWLDGIQNLLTITDVAGRRLATYVRPGDNGTIIGRR